MQVNSYLKLEENVIYLTYSWGIGNKGICGHTFELIDYFWILKDFFNVKILICDDLDEEIFKNAIINKYDFNDYELTYILKNCIFKNRPKIVIGDYIIIVDGNLMKDKNIVLKFKQIVLFSCGITNNHFLKDKNVLVLQDYRIYENSEITFNYKKKILFSRLKKIEKCNNKSLLYITKNCRNISDIELLNLKKTNEQFIAVVNKFDKYDIELNHIEFVEAPVNNIFEQFNKYYYTAVPRKFDCSPRFIAECKFYNKEVIYLIDYLEEDKGLYWRKYDLENDFKSIELTESDEIVLFLKEVVNNKKDKSDNK